MISPELLRRYPFFGFMDETQLANVAMLADEIAAEKGETLFEVEQPADTLYLLLEGNIDLHYIVIDREDPRIRKDFFVSEINPGEILGLSAFIEPYQYTLTAIVTNGSRLVKFNAAGLRELQDSDPKLGCGIMRQVAKALMSRLNDTRIQLVAART